MHDSDDAAKVRVFPPAVPLVTVLLGVAADYLVPIELAETPSANVRLTLGALIAVGSVLGFGLRSVLLLRRSGQSENPWKPTSEIMQEGPFRFSRNPMYLQMVLVCVGLSIMLWNIWILLLTPVCAWTLQKLVIIPEEVYLERKFGDTYLQYKRRVRRWI